MGSVHAAELEAECARADEAVAASGELNSKIQVHACSLTPTLTLTLTLRVPRSSSDASGAGSGTQSSRHLMLCLEPSANSTSLQQLRNAHLSKTSS